MKAFLNENETLALLNRIEECHEKFNSNNKPSSGYLETKIPGHRYISDCTDITIVSEKEFNFTFTDEGSHYKAIVSKLGGIYSVEVKSMK